tara:strand:+ start:375 stop:893 length:519 start_codon:yes stop_codon:yes gene_type:complete
MKELNLIGFKDKIVLAEYAHDELLNEIERLEAHIRSSADDQRTLNAECEDLIQTVQARAAVIVKYEQDKKALGDGLYTLVRDGVEQAMDDRMDLEEPVMTDDEVDDRIDRWFDNNFDIQDHFNLADYQDDIQQIALDVINDETGYDDLAGKVREVVQEMIAGGEITIKVEVN